jgi:hypothetical protein
MRDTGKMGSSCTEHQCGLMQTRDIAAARSNQAQSCVVHAIEQTLALAVVGEGVVAARIRYANGFEAP